jgi:hypothetical protein
MNDQNYTNQAGETEIFNKIGPDTGGGDKKYAAEQQRKIISIPDGTARVQMLETR